MRSRNRQLLPAFNDKHIEVPGRQGALLFPGELQDRMIELECAFVEAGLPNIRTRAREIAAWLYTQGREILSFDDESDKYYKAKLDGAIDFEHIARMGQFGLVFRCEPLAYGGEQAETFNDFMAVVNNPGNYPSPPIFQVTFTSAANSFEVIGSDTSTVTVTHDFEAGDVLDMNFASGLIDINGTRALDKLDWQNSRFFSLRPGGNTLMCSPSDVNVRVSWIPRYL